MQLRLVVNLAFVRAVLVLEEKSFARGVIPAPMHGDMVIWWHGERCDGGTGSSMRHKAGQLDKDLLTWPRVGWLAIPEPSGMYV